MLPSRSVTSSVTILSIVAFHKCGTASSISRLLLYSCMKEIRFVSLYQRKQCLSKRIRPVGEKTTLQMDNFILVGVKSRNKNMKSLLYSWISGNRKTWDERINFYSSKVLECWILKKIEQFLESISQAHELPVCHVLDGKRTVNTLRNLF